MKLYLDNFYKPCSIFFTFRSIIYLETFFLYMVQVLVFPYGHLVDEKPLIRKTFFFSTDCIGKFVTNQVIIILINLFLHSKLFYWFVFSCMVSYWLNYYSFIMSLYSVLYVLKFFFNIALANLDYLSLNIHFRINLSMSTKKVMLGFYLGLS